MKSTCLKITRLTSLASLISRATTGLSLMSLMLASPPAAAQTGKHETLLLHAARVFDGHNMIGRFLMSMTMGSHMIAMVMPVRMATRPWRAGLAAGFQSDLDHDRARIDQVANRFSCFFFRGYRCCDILFPCQRNRITARGGDDGSRGKHTQGAISPVGLVYRSAYVPDGGNPVLQYSIGRNTLERKVRVQFDKTGQYRRISQIDDFRIVGGE